MALTSLVCSDLAKWGQRERVLPKMVQEVYLTFSTRQSRLSRSEHRGVGVKWLPAR